MDMFQLVSMLAKYFVAQKEIAAEIWKPTWENKVSLKIIPIIREKVLEVTDSFQMLIRTHINRLFQEIPCTLQPLCNFHKMFFCLTLRAC